MVALWLTSVKCVQLKLTNMTDNFKNKNFGKLFGTFLQIMPQNTLCIIM